MVDVYLFLSFRANDYRAQQKTPKGNQNTLDLLLWKNATRSGLIEEQGDKVIGKNTLSLPLENKVTNKQLENCKMLKNTPRGVYIQCSKEKRKNNERRYTLPESNPQRIEQRA